MATRIHKLNPFEDLGIIGTLQNDVILLVLGGVCVCLSVDLFVFHHQLSKRVDG